MEIYAAGSRDTSGSHRFSEVVNGLKRESKGGDSSFAGGSSIADVVNVLKRKSKGGDISFNGTSLRRESKGADNSFLGRSRRESKGGENSIRFGRSNSVYPGREGSNSGRIKGGSHADSHYNPMPTERRGQSECFGEVAFFSETPSGESVWSSSIVRVLVVSRAILDTLQTTYPNEISKTLNSLKVRAENEMRKEIEQALAFEVKKAEVGAARGSKSEKPLHALLSPYLSRGKLTTINLPSNLLMELKNKLPPAQGAHFNQLRQ